MKTFFEYDNKYIQWSFDKWKIRVFSEETKLYMCGPDGKMLVQRRSNEKC